MRSRKIPGQLPPVADELRAFAAQIRMSMTEEELILWSRLKNRQLGVKFLRQRPIGPYVGDFVSIEAGLVIELDGSQHYEESKEKRDSQRSEYLTRLGFEVLRFGNNEIRQNLAGVLQVIQERIAFPPCLQGGN